MVIRLILVLALLCTVSGQIILPVEIENCIECGKFHFENEGCDWIQGTVTPSNITVVDTTFISEEELFLKKISDEALAKEEKRKVITNKILAIIIIYLLVDRIINK